MMTIRKRITETVIKRKNKKILIKKRTIDLFSHGFHSDRERSTFSPLKRTPSESSSFFLPAIPPFPEYPVRLPSAATTLWHGVCGASGFILINAPIALADLGLPTNLAIFPYVATFPLGILRVCSYTRSFSDIYQNYTIIPHIPFIPGRANLLSVRAHLPVSLLLHPFFHT